MSSAQELVDAVSIAVRTAAERAILPRFRQLSSAAIIEKSPGDYVTDADHETEALLTSALTALEPGVPIIGEEAMAVDATPMDEAHAHERVWVIDPSTERTRSSTAAPTSPRWWHWSRATR